ncbi:MAG: FHA domain-containing protein, partial [Planctomycetes bacterium]|nr:FHA domain-containing protein [Planctomycetota bacterium]
MRLTVEQNGKPVSDLKFEQGPIYVGRQLGSQVFLPEVTVSRQHAVIYMTKGGAWVVEDLDSANKTFINNSAIHKHNIQDGDVVRIADFAITIALDGEPAPDEQPGDKTGSGPQMEDTIIEVRHDVHTIVRRLKSRDAPKVALP